VVFCPETSPPPHVYTATGLQLAAFELSVTPLYPRPHVDELHACWVRRVLLLGRTERIDPTNGTTVRPAPRVRVPNGGRTRVWLAIMRTDCVIRGKPDQAVRHAQVGSVRRSNSYRGCAHGRIVSREDSIVPCVLLVVRAGPPHSLVGKHSGTRESLVRLEDGAEKKCMCIPCACSAPHSVRVHPPSA